MFLQEWLNYRKNCPLCQSPLTIYLHSQKRQSIKFENGRMIVFFPLTSIKRTGKDFKVGYSFGLTDNSFRIEFYDYNLFPIETAPFLLKKFEDLNKSLGSYKIYKHCNSCHRYSYASGVFSILSPNLTTIHPLEVVWEFFGFIQNYGGPKDDRFHIYKLVNSYIQEECSVSYFVSNNIRTSQFDTDEPENAQCLDLPIIPFVSVDKTLARIKKLIVLS